MNFFKNNNKALSALYHSSGINETDLQHFDKAISDINRAIKLDPGNEDYYSSLALAYTNNGDFQAGIDNYIKAMPGCKDDKVTLSSYYSYCAENAYYLKDYKKVIENCTRAIELYPSHVSPYYYLGKVYLKVLNKKDLAIQNFEKGMNIDTSKKSDNYIFSLFYVGNPYLAYKKMHDRLLSETGNDQILSDYYNMACLLSLMNKKEEANTYLKKAIDLGYSKKYALSEEDLNNIRDTQEFKNTMAIGGEKQ
jgi:tetratricopeptide (TPR) repeat protein